MVHKWLGSGPQGGTLGQGSELKFGPPTDLYCKVPDGFQTLLKGTLGFLKGFWEEALITAAVLAGTATIGKR
jgi:hypothetical protein